MLPRVYANLDAKHTQFDVPKSLQPMHSPPPLILPQTPLLSPAITASSTATTSKMPSSTTQKKLIQTYNQTVPHGYLLYGPECKIPDIDPLAKDVMKLYHPEEHK